MNAHALLWRRLDVPGHDACRVAPVDGGWELHGTAVFLHDGAPARLDYRVLCDGSWTTRTGSVRGFVAGRRVDVAVERTPEGVWSMDGRHVPGLEGCAHLDLGFTPATNLPHVRQLMRLDDGPVDLPVAWLDVPPCPLRRLPQRYQRRSPTAYWYEAPTVGYAALLELTPSGFVRLYPELWALEACWPPAG